MFSYIQSVHVVQKIKQNEQYCVKKYEQEKIFLNPENISITNEGLILRVNSYESIPIPFLQSNNEGCFISIKIEPKMNIIKERLPWSCDRCGYQWNYWASVYCERCGEYRYEENEDIYKGDIIP